MDIVKEAAEIAQATEFIETKSAKYESPIAQVELMYLVDRSKDFQLQGLLLRILRYLYLMTAFQHSI